MVAFVTGVSSGLDHLTGLVLKEQQQAGTAALGRSGDNVYLNTLTGSFIDQRTDEILTGVGQDDVVTRTYNSQSANPWFYNFQQSVAGLIGTVNTAGSTITRTAADGTQILYTYNTTLGLYTAVEGHGQTGQVPLGGDQIDTEDQAPDPTSTDTLSYSASTSAWTWSDPSTQAQNVYDGAHGGRLLSSTDADGNGLTYSYNTSGQLSQITTQDGETTTLTWSGSQLTSIVTGLQGGSSLTRVHYGYDSSGRLQTVTVDLSPSDSSTSDGNVYTITYGYDGTSNRVASITQTDGSSLQIGYTLVGSSYRVSSLTQTVSAGVTRTTNIAYDTVNRITTVSDPLNSSVGTKLAYDASGNLLSITAPAVGGAPGQVTSFTYDTSGRVLTSATPAGETTTYGYDGDGNRISEVDPLGDTVTRTYDASNNLLTLTQYVTAAQGGTAAATPETTRYAYDAKNHLAYAISAQGDVTQYLHNGSGELTDQVLFTANSYNLTGLGPSQSISKTTMDSWVGGIADKSTTQLTHTDYDFRGNIAKVTSYGRTLAGGAGDTTGDISSTTYVYDQAGNLLTRLPAGSSTQSVTTPEAYVYDGLGRVKVFTDLSGTITNTVFSDPATTTVVQLANGATRTSLYDKAGELITETDAGPGVTTAVTAYQYDADGRLTMSTDPDGINRYFLYDNDGRKVADVTADGALTETRYNADNQVVATIAYNTKLAPAQISGLASASPGAPVALAAVRPTASSSDRWSWSIYDGDQRLIETIDATGAATAYTYDGTGNVTSTVDYATTFSAAVLASFKTTPPTTLQTPLSDTLTAANDSLSTPQGQAITFDPRGNDYDSLGNPFTITAVGTAAHGTVTIGGGGTSLTYSPTAGYTGSDSFTYTISDGSVAAAGTDTVTVTSTDHAPVAVADVITATAGAAYTFDPRANDTDIDADTLTVTGVGTAAHGTVSFTGTSVTYTPTAGYTGADSFTYTISDGKGGTATASVAATVTAAASFTAQNVSLATYQSQPFVFDPRASGSSSGNYVLTITSVSTPSHGAAWINGGGANVTYWPNSGYVGSDSFTYTLSDGHGRTATATATVQMAANQTQTLTTSDVSYYQTDYNYTTGVNLYSASTVSNYLGSGSTALVIQDTHNNSGFSQRNVLFDMDDAGSGGSRFSVTGGQNVEYSLNAIDIGYSAFFYTGVHFFDQYGNDLGVSSFHQGGWTTSSWQTFNGTATAPSNAASADVFVEFIYYSSTSSTYGVAFENPTFYELASGNHAPVANNDILVTTSAGSTIDPRANDADLDNDSLSITSVGSAAHGTVTYTGSSITYTPTAGFTGADSFTYTVSDGNGGTSTATVNVAVTGNHAPVASNVSLTTAKNTALTLDPRAASTDSDGDTLTISAVGSASHGTVTINGGTSVTYTPNTAYAGADSFTYTVSDGHGGTSTATINLMVSPPQLENDLKATQVGAPITFDPRANDTDPNSSAMTITAVGSAGHGTVSFTGTGVTYTPATGYTGADSFTYTVTDAAGASSTATVFMTVNAAPAPAANPNDRTTQFFYDADGRLVGALNAANYLTQIVYDGAGQKVRTIQYTNVPTVTTGTFASILASVTASSSDLYSWNLYDSRGYLAASIDGAGDLTRYHYTPMGDLDQQISGQVLSVSSLIATPPALAGLPSAPGGTVLNTTNYTRNVFGQVLSEQQVLAGGTTSTTAYTYDNVTHRLLTQTTDSGLSDARTSRYRYDVFGRMIGELTGVGAATLVASPTDAQIAAAIAIYGTSFSYDAAGRLISKTTPNGSTSNSVGNTTLYYYDVDGRLKYVVNPLGETTEYDYDTFGEQSDVITYGKRVSSTNLSSMIAGLSSPSAGEAGTVASIVAGLSDTTVGSPTQQSDAHTDYDLDGRASDTIDAVGATNTFAYDAFGELTSRTDQLNGSTTTQTAYGYNRRGLQTTVTVDSGGLNLTTTTAYDSFNRAYRVTDANGNVTTDTLDGAGRVTGEADSAGLTTFTYDGRGNLTTSTNSAGGVTTHAYSQFGRQATMTTPAGFTTTIQKNAYGQTVSTTDALGDQTIYAYDADGNLTYRTDAAGSSMEYDYDTADRLVQSQQHLFGPNQGVSYSYDAAGRLLTETVDPGGANLATTYAYDAKGEEVQVTDPYGVITTYAHDLDGRTLTQVVDAGTGSHLNLTTQYAYDLGGREITVTQAAGTSAQRVTSYTYDNAGRLTKSVVDPSGLQLTTQYAYDADGNLVAQTDASNALTRYVYDADNRQTLMVDAVGDVTQTSYTVNSGEGEVIAIRRYANRVAGTTLASWPSAISAATVTAAVATSTKDEVTTQLFNVSGQLAFVIDAQAHLTRYDYDQAGRRIDTIQYANPITAASSYDINYVLSQMSSLGLDGQAGNRIIRTVYDQDGRVAYSIDPTGAVTGYVYNGGGQLVKQTQYATLYTASGEPTLATMTGWLATTVTDGAYSGAISGDTANRITRSMYDNAARLAYQVDGGGYITAYTYGAHFTQTLVYAGAYTSANGDAVTDSMLQADIATLLTSHPSDAVVTTYGYDNAGRLNSTSIDIGGGANLATHRTLDAIGNVVDSVAGYGTSDAADTHNTYDAAGRLITQTKGSGSATPSTTVFAYDAMGRLTGKLSANGYSDYLALGSNPTAAAVANLVRANGVGYTYDAVGRVLTTGQAVDNNTSPATVATTTNEYDAFGNLIKVTDPNGASGYFYYDLLNEQIIQVDPQRYGTITSYSFGQVVQVERYALGATNSWSETTLPTFTSSVTDEITHIVRDKDNRVTSTVDAESHTQSYVLDAFGDQIHSTNKVGATTTNSYDNRGLLTKQVLPIQSVTYGGGTEASSVTNTYQYDSRSNRTQMVEAAGLTEQRTTDYTYDKANRLLQTIMVGVASDRWDTSSGLIANSSTNLTSTLVYDARGNVIESDDADGNRTLFFYDLQDNRIAEVSPTGTLTTWGHDSYGNVTSQTVYGDAVSLPGSPGGAPPSPVNSANYRETDYTYDRANRVIDTTVDNVFTGRRDDSSGYLTTTGNLVTQTTYDLNGNVVETIDPMGAATFYYYNKLGQKIAQVDPDGYMTFYQLNQDGNVMEEDQFASSLSQLGLTASTSSDPVAMRATAQAANNTNDRITQFTYDRNGNRLTESRLNVLAYRIDDSSGLIYAVGGPLVTSTITYTYDGLGDVLSKSQATGDTTTYSYDNLGRQLCEVDPLVYNPNGVSVQQEIETDRDGLGNVDRIETKQVGGGFQRTASNVYGAGGRLTASYDAGGFGKTYIYDADGNVLQVSYARELSNGSSVAEAINYKYDASGELVSQVSGDLVGSTWTYGDQTQIAYDAYGEMAARGLNGLWNESFAYDNAGRLWKTNSGDGVWKLYGYDMDGNKNLDLVSTGADLSGYSSLSGALATLYGSSNPEKYARSDVVATLYKYDLRGQLTYTYQPFRELDQAHDLAAGASTTVEPWSSHTYDSFGDDVEDLFTNMVSPTSSTTQKTDYAYNTLGKLIQTTLSPVGYTDESGVGHYDGVHPENQIRPVLNSYYDVSGRQIGSRDANGNLTYRRLVAGTGYDGTTAVTSKQVNPDGGVSTYNVDTYGEVTSITDALGNLTKYWYNPVGSLVAVSYPTRSDGTHLTDFYRYDGLGQMIKQTNSQLSSGVSVAPYMDGSTDRGASVNWGSSPDLRTTDYDSEGRVLKTVDYQAYLANYGSITGDPGQITTYGYAWSSTISGLPGESGGWTTTTTNSLGVLKDDRDYFGRAVKHTDYQAHVDTYTYDRGGRLTLEQDTTQSNTSQTYTYYNTGQIATQVSKVQALYETSYGVSSTVNLNDTSTYGYDSNGNRITEQYVQTSPTSVTLESEAATYDELNRLAYVTDSVTGTNTHTYYDLNGNIRRIDSHFTSLVDGSAQESDQWFKYDAMNRFVVTQGSLVGGAIQAYNTSTGYYGGTDFTYDADGNRKTATTYSASATHTDYFTYSADGYLIAVTSGDASGTVALATATYTSASYARDALGRVTEDYEQQPGGVVYDRKITGYDADSNITSDDVMNDQGSWWLHSLDTFSYTAVAGGGVATGSYVGAVGLQTTTNYQVYSGSSPTLLGTDTLSNEYDLFNSALENLIVYNHNPTGGSSSTTDTGYTYDTSGQLVNVHVSDGAPHDIQFVNNADGEVLQRQELSPTYPTVASHGPLNDYYYLDGKQIGQVTNNGSTQVNFAVGVVDRMNPPSATSLWANASTSGPGGAQGASDFNSNYQAINPQSIQDAAQSYTVQAGDTLQSIAQKLWGDASLWYLLANANGLSLNSTLPAGRLLTIPNTITNAHNNSATSEVYDPSKVVGDVSPTQLTQPPPPATTTSSSKHHGGCGVIGEILSVVVAVVVVAVLHVPVGDLINGLLAASPISDAVVGTVATLAEGAAVGALGGIAAEGVAVATGNQSGFSWKGVALNAVSGGIAAGVSMALPNSVFGSAAEAGFVRGGIDSALTQGIGVTTGLQSKFDWTGVSVSAIGGGVDAAFSHSSLLTNSVEATIAGGLAGGLAGAATRSLITGTDFGDNILADLPSAIGNTIGNLIAGSLVQPPQSMEVTPYQQVNLNTTSPLANVQLQTSIPNITYGDDGNGYPAAITPMAPLPDVSAAGMTATAGVAVGGWDGGASSIAVPAQSQGNLVKEVLVTGQQYGVNNIEGLSGKPVVLDAAGETLAVQNGEVVLTGRKLPWLQIELNRAWDFITHGLPNDFAQFGRTLEDAPNAFGQGINRGVNYFITRPITRAEQYLTHNLTTPGGINRMVHDGATEIWAAPKQIAQTPAALAILTRQKVQEYSQDLSAGGFHDMTVHMASDAGFVAPGVAASVVPGGGEIDGAEIAISARTGLGGVDAAETAAPKVFADGSFSVTDWTGYPEFLPKPAGPMNLLETGSDELVSAQRLKAVKNDELREAFGLRGVDMDIHEIQPVKFGGSPTDLSNKLLIPRDLHQQVVTPFWNGLTRDLEPYVYRPPKPGN